MSEKLDAVSTFVACMGISSIAGLASLIRSGRVLTWKATVGAVLYSGVMGLLIGMLWWSEFGGDTNPYFTITISGFAGIGGTSLLDFLLQIIIRGGVHITVQPGEAEPKLKKPGSR